MTQAPEQHAKKISASKVLLSFGPFFRPYRSQILLWFLVYGAFYVLGIGTPLAIKYYVDHVLHSPAATLWLFVCCYGIFALGYHCFYYFGFRGTQRIIETVVADLRFTVYEKLHRLNIGFFDKNVSGEIVNHVLNDTRQLLNLVGGELVQVTLQTGTGIICTSLLLLWNLRLGLTVLAFLPVYGLIFYHYLPRVRRAARLWRRAEDRLWGNWAEKLRGMSVVQAFARERKEALRHYARGHDSASTWYRMSLFGVQMNVLGGLTAQVSQQAVFALGCVLVLHLDLKLGEWVSLSTLIGFVLAPVQSAFNVANIWQQSTASAERIQKVLQEVEEVRKSEGAKSVGKLKGDLRFEHISFAYEPDAPVLKELSFSIEAGENVALVGHTGCGKTSVISLLQGFYRPQKGTILIDGIPLNDLKIQDLRSNLGVVPQDIQLFNDSLRANVAYGKQGATDAEIWKVLEAAQVDDFVRRLPSGLDTRISGEEGLHPSAGEAQRLAIARAILIDPSVVILDEATASMDSAEEARLQEAMQRLLKGRTAILIAHRLSTLSHCDRIFVMDAGRLVEEGSPAMLLSRPESLYSAMQRSHSSGGAHG